jgi:hypothetical protein
MPLRPVTQSASTVRKVEDLLSDGPAPATLGGRGPESYCLPHPGSFGLPDKIAGPPRRSLHNPICRPSPSCDANRRFGELAIYALASRLRQAGWRREQRRCPGFRQGSRTPWRDRCPEKGSCSSTRSTIAPSPFDALSEIGVTRRQVDFDNSRDERHGPPPSSVDISARSFARLVSIPHTGRLAPAAISFPFGA